MGFTRKTGNEDVLEGFKACRSSIGPDRHITDAFCPMMKGATYMEAHPTFSSRLSLGSPKRNTPSASISSIDTRSSNHLHHKNFVTCKAAEYKNASAAFTPHLAIKYSVSLPLRLTFPSSGLPFNIGGVANLEIYMKSTEVAPKNSQSSSRSPTSTVCLHPCHCSQLPRISTTFCFCFWWWEFLRAFRENLLRIRELYL